MAGDKLIRGPQLRKQYLGGIDNSTLWRWRRQRGFPRADQGISGCEFVAP